LIKTSISCRFGPSVDTTRLKSFYCVAIDCGPLDGVHNALLSSIESTTYNSSATFQCSPGYWFCRGVYSITSTCRDNGLWTALEFNACKR